VSYDTWLESPYQTEESREDIEDAISGFNRSNDYDLYAEATFTRSTYTIEVFDEGRDDGSWPVAEFDESLNGFDEWVSMLGRLDHEDALAEIDRSREDLSEERAAKAFRAFQASTRLHAGTLDNEAYEPGSPKRSDYANA
jgi:hypothetical protein